MSNRIDNAGTGLTMGSSPWVEKLKRIMPFMLGLYIFLNPFPATSPKEIIFYSTALMFICLAFSPGKPFTFRSPLAVPFVLFAAWSAVSLFFALDKAASLNDYFAHLLKLILLYYMLVNFFRSGRRLEILSWLVIVSTSILALVLTLHWYVVLGNPLTSRLGVAYTSYGNVTNGYYTVFGLALALRQLNFEDLRYRRRILMVSVAVLGAASILSQARSTLLALVVAVGILYIRRIKVLVAVALLLVAVIAATPLKHRFTQWSEYSIRIGQFLYTAEIIKDYPVFGIGFSVDTLRDDALIDREHYMPRIPKQFQNPVHPYLWPHNMFFSTAVRTGLPGAALFTLFFIFPALTGWRLASRGHNAAVRSWGLCGLACLGMFFVKGNLDQAFLSSAEIIFFTILAIITITWNLDRAATERGQVPGTHHAGGEEKGAA